MVAEARSRNAIPASRGRRWLGGQAGGRARAFVLIATALLSVSSAGAQEALVTVPNFFDPAARTLRPPPGTVRGIRFVTSDDFPPFNFVDASDRLTGFNIDLARALCEEVAVPCTMEALPFGDLAASIVEGRADAAIGGIAITPETRSSLAFSEVYFRLPARFATRLESDLEMAPGALAGRRVSVVAGSAHAAYLAAYFGTVEAVAYPTPEAARIALRSAQVDATFGDGVQLAFWLQGTASAGCCLFAGGPYLDATFFGEGLAIALRPGDEALRDTIDAAMAVLDARGLLAELYLRYFPIGFF